MSFSATQSLTIAVGILFGLVWTRRTGWSCGGIITPGLLALSDPVLCALSLAVGAILVFPLRLLRVRLCLYGRERIGAAMLLAITVKILFPFGGGWLGWVVPGLIAADAERQGLLMTICGTLCCAAATKFFFILLSFSGVM